MNLPSSYLSQKVSHLRGQLDDVQDPYELLPLLDEISFYLWRIDPTKAGEYARRQIRIANGIRDEHWVMRGCLRYACSLEARSQFTLARRCFKKAWRLLEREPDNHAEKSFVCRRLAENLNDTGNTDGAMRFLALALEYARQSGDRREIVATLGASGEFYRESGLYAEALDRLEEALGMFEEIAPSDELAFNGIAHVRFSLGRVYEVLEDQARAANHYAEGLELVQHIGDKFGEMIACGGMGSVAAKQARYGDSFGWYGRAMALAEELGDVDRQADTLVAMGTVHALQGDYNNALDYLNRAAERFAAIGSELGKVHVLIEKGEVMIALRKWKSAMSLLSEAALFLDGTELRTLRSRIHRLMAQTCEHLGDVGKALEHYQRFMKLEKEVISNEVRGKLIGFEIRERERIMETERSSHVNKAKELEREVEHRSKEMTTISLRLAQTDDLLGDLRKRILDIKQINHGVGNLVGNIIGDIDRNRSNAQAWEAFEQQLYRLDQEFIGNLKSRYPQLTPMERRICLLLRMSLSNKEVAGLLNVSDRTVDTHRTSIRRKIGLQRTENLIAALAAL